MVCGAPALTSTAEPVIVELSSTEHDDGDSILRL